MKLEEIRKFFDEENRKLKRENEKVLMQWWEKNEKCFEEIENLKQKMREVLKIIEK